MRIVLKSFLSGGPHEGSPGDIRDVEPDQAEHLIAVGAAVAAPEPEEAPVTNPASGSSDDAGVNPAQAPDTVDVEPVAEFVEPPSAPTKQAKPK